MEPKAPQQVTSDVEACNVSPVHSSFLQLSVITPLLKGSVALATDHPQLRDWEHLSLLARQHFLTEEGQNTGRSQGPGWDKLPQEHRTSTNIAALHSNYNTHF